jgi:flagellum-specific peptidoglycan hydrolase FlgJ
LGQSELATKANNLFGIKADASWKGAKYAALTNEVINGQTVQVMADFRKYNNQAESLKDYVTKIKTTKNGSAFRYQAVWRQCKNLSKCSPSIERCWLCDRPKLPNKFD